MKIVNLQGLVDVTVQILQSFVSSYATARLPPTAESLVPVAVPLVWWIYIWSIHKNR